MLDYKKIEAKWQKAWADAKLFEAEPNDRKSILITAAWPYVNSPQHIGHFRTYGTADTYARYMRMRGYNVLFPMGFHKTGTPILAIAKRVANGDKDLLDDLINVYHIPKEDIEKMTDPLFVAEYFSNEIEYGMRKAGFSIDWRRKFNSIDPLFSKMVEWQFNKLKGMGYLTQGAHPVGWCPNENNAVGQHDTKHDVQPEMEKLIAVKFKDADSDAYFACATYRPETIYGVTNLFVNDSIEYVEAQIDKSKYFIAKAAAELLSHQFKIDVLKNVPALELRAKKAINPFTKESIPVLNGDFVKEDVGTGVVMSVPAHAPFDYVTLKRLEIQGSEVPKEPYPVVIRMDNTMEALPALVYLESFGWEGSQGNDVIERATKMIYREESRNGKMVLGEFEGIDEPTARIKISNKLMLEGNAFEIYTLSNDEPVVCRCGTRVVVKIVEDQWFINYGNEEWKRSVKEHMKAMKLYPEKLRHTYEGVVDWIGERAAERAQGLGTKFPFNMKYMIESLSDSTIYMCFYTFYHVLMANSVKAESLSPEFFDYVLNSLGELEEVSSHTGIDSSVIAKCRESFNYWYAFTSRHSGSDLIYNHLTMYVFNHVMAFPERYWPKQIVTNGLVVYEGEKMSKSIGNIIPLKEAIAKFGADPLKIVTVASVEIDAESDFKNSLVSGINSRLSYFESEISGLDGMRGNELEGIDFWLYSKLNSKIRDATVLMDNIVFKAAYDGIFYSSVSELKRYHGMGGDNKLVLQEYLSAVVKMLYPIMPHVSEEFWHMLGNGSLVANEQWPVADEGMIDRELEACQSVMDATAEDMGRTIELTGRMDSNQGKKISLIRLIVAEPWKTDAYNMLVEGKQQGEIIGSIKGDRSAIANYIKQFRNVKELTDKIDVDSMALFKALNDAREYLQGRFGAPIEVEREGSSTSKRASRAQPNRPSIEVVWS